MENYLMKKGLALFLVLIMCIGILPVSAFAAGDPDGHSAVSQLAHKHTWSKWTVTKEPTCTEKGEQKRTCSGCGKVETQEIPTVPHDFKWEIPDPDSDDEDENEDEVKTIIVEWTVTKPATCTEKGEKERVCKVCGKVEKKEIKKTDHSFGKWEVTKAATCTEKGEKVRVCEICGKTETKEIKKTDHSFSEWEETKIATCAEKGERVRTCGICGKTETEEIKKTDHSFGDWEVKEEASCDREGTEERVCSACGKTETKTIPVIPHVFGEDGICTVCGAVSKNKPKEKLITISYAASEGGKVSISSETVNVLDKKAAAKGAVAEASVGDWYFRNWTDAKGKVVSEKLCFVPPVDKKSGDMSFTANYVLMPASNSSISAGGASVSYSYEAGTFPAGTEISVVALSTDEAKAFVAKATGKKIVDAVAFDITFSNGGKNLQPENGKGVSISMEFRKLEGKDPVFVCEGAGAKGGSGGKATESSASFFATHFSIYAVGTEGYYRRTYVFYDKDGTAVVSRQSVRENDSLYDPGVADIGENEEFLGWIPKGSDPETAVPKTVDELNEELRTAVFDEEQTLEYVPLVKETDNGTETAITVKYDLNGGTGTIPDRTCNAGDIAVAAAAPAAPEGMKFIHWAYGSGKTVAAGGRFEIIETDAVENVITMTAVYGDLAYTVITFNGNGGLIGENETVSSGKIAVNEAVDVPPASSLIREGYVFTGWNTMADGSGVSFPADQARIAADNVDAYGNSKENVLYAQWREIKPIYVTVIGGAKLDGNEIENDDGVIEVVYDGQEHRIDGYTVTARDAEGNTVTDYRASDVSITKKASAKGTHVYASDDISSPYCMGITEEHCVNLNGNYRVVEFEVKDGVLSILKRTVTLTSETADKTYDGTALAKPDVAVGGDGFVPGEVTDIKATGTVKNVTDGEVVNTITWTEGENFKAGNYTIVKTEGNLKISPLAVTVTVTGKTAQEKYDGKEHKLAGYDISVSDKLYTEKDFTFSGKAEAKGKNAGTYQMGLKDDQFKNDNENFTVTFMVTDGKLVIVQPKTIVITINGHTGVRTYNGSYQSVEGFDVMKVEGAPAGTESSIAKKVKLKDGYNANTGGWKAVGTYYMKLTANHFKPITITDYSVVFVVNDGCMVINPAPVTVTAENITKYAGEKDPSLRTRVTGLIGNDTIKYDLRRQAGENAGTYKITPSGDSRQGQYTVTYISGTLTITEPYHAPANTVPSPAPGPSIEPDAPLTPSLPQTTPSVPGKNEANEPAAAPDKEQTPGSRPEWALINLILGIITTIVGAVTALSILEENEAKSGQAEKKTASLKWNRLLGLIPAAASVITFLLTENMAHKMVLADKWTILMIVYAIVGTVIAVITCSRKHEKD